MADQVLPLPPVPLVVPPDPPVPHVMPFTVRHEMVLCGINDVAQFDKRTVLTHVRIRCLQISKWT